MGDAYKITVIVPAMNEEECIGEMLREIPKDIVHEILVIDGHSTDKTVQIVKDLGIDVMPQEGKGYGAAVSTGLKYAKGDLITFMDADGSYNPSALAPLLNKIKEGNDVVFCSRYLPESGSDDDTPIRFIGNKLFTLMLNVMHGVKISDSLYLYILAKKEIFSRIHMKSKNFEYCIEFPIRIHKAGMKYTEIPSKERKRIAGESKVNAFYHGLRILGTLIQG